MAGPVWRRFHEDRQAEPEHIDSIHEGKEPEEAQTRNECEDPGKPRRSHRIDREFHGVLAVLLPSEGRSEPIDDHRERIDEDEGDEPVKESAEQAGEEAAPMAMEVWDVCPKHVAP